jgi:hypothetical protein
VELAAGALPALPPLPARWGPAAGMDVHVYVILRNAVYFVCTSCAASARQVGTSCGDGRAGFGNLT